MIPVGTHIGRGGPAQSDSFSGFFSDRVEERADEGGARLNGRQVRLIMANPEWTISGDHFEAGSCDSVCPCPASGMAARPTRGFCNAGLVFHVEPGSHGATPLDGFSFAVLLHTPGPMIAGNWTVGMVVDDRATAEQREALVAIGSGQAGGPMAAVGPLVGTFAGAEAQAIRIERSGMRRSVSIPGVLDIAVEGIPGASQTEPIYLGTEREGCPSGGGGGRPRGDFISFVDEMIQ